MGIPFEGRVNLRPPAAVPEAAADVGITLRVAATLGQGGGHPVLLTVPETRYLKGLLLDRAD